MGTWTPIIEVTSPKPMQVVKGEVEIVFTVKGGDKNHPTYPDSGSPLTNVYLWAGNIRLVEDAPGVFEKSYHIDWDSQELQPQGKPFFGMLYLIFFVTDLDGYSRTKAVPIYLDNREVLP